MLDEQARKETARALERAVPFIRRHVGAHIRLRRVPELQFRFDESIGHQDRIEQLLQELKQTDAERAAQLAAEDASHVSGTPSDTDDDA